MNADGSGKAKVTSNSDYDGFPNWGTEAIDNSTPLAPSVVDSHPSPAGPVDVGTAVSDSATVAASGTSGLPQGTVTFSICGPLAAASGCASGGTAVGTPKSTDGSGGPVVSDSFTPDKGGFYCFRADYSGGGQFAPSSDGSAQECFQVSAQQSGPTYTVNTTADHADASGCTDVDCSLREAINAANAHDGPATIDFSILPVGPQTIALTSPLPAVQNTTTIDGLSQPGSLRGPGIVLDGTATPVGTDGLVLQASGSVVHDLAFQNFPRNAIVVRGNNVQLTHNLIGTTQLGGIVFHNGGNGIFVDGADGVQITNNLVASNLLAGIYLTNSATGAVITRNTIGGTGPEAVPGNAGPGVRIDQGSDGNQIGGTGSGDGNRIAFNTGAGVSVASQHNQILGNSIDANGAGGIDLGATGNQLQAPPLLAAARESGNQLNIVGKFIAPGDTYRIEFFLNQACIDPTKAAGPNEGATFIGWGSKTVNAGGEAAINAFIDISNIPAGAGNVVTATATSSSGNTSEFSKRCITITQGGTASDATLSLSESTATTTPGASAVPLSDIPPSAFGNALDSTSGSTSSAPLGAIPLGAIPLGAIPLGAIPLGAIPLGAIGLTPQALLQDGLGGVPLNSIPLKAPKSWDAELQNTALAGLPTQTLTLRDVLSLNPLPPDLQPGAASPVGLRDMDLSLSPLGAIPLGAIALG